MKNSIIIIASVATIISMSNCSNKNTTGGNGSGNPSPSTSGTTENTIKMSINNEPEKTYNILGSALIIKPDLNDNTVNFKLMIEDPTTTSSPLVEISVTVLNNPSLSTVGTYPVTKGKLVGDTYVIDSEGKDKIASAVFYESSTLQSTTKCGTTSEGTITITEQTITSKNDKASNSFLGYVSGNFSLKVCDGKGNSKTLKGSFEKSSTNFMGNFKF